MLIIYIDGKSYFWAIFNLDCIDYKVNFSLKSTLLLFHAIIVVGGFFWIVNKGKIDK